MARDNWVWLAAVPVVVLAYLGSGRSVDALTLAIGGLAVLGVVYWICLYHFGRNAKWKFVVDLIVWETAAAIGFMFNPELKELAGIVYYVIHFVIALIVGLAFVANVGHTILQAVKEPAERSTLCSRCGYDRRATPDPAGPLFERCPECGHEGNDRPQGS